MRYRDPKLTELLAAEYVLGTLQGPARRRFEGLLQAYPKLRQQVQEWELRLSPLLLTAPPVKAPPKTWRQLQQRLFPTTSNPLGFWRNLACASSLTAALLGITLWVQLTAPQPPSYLITVNPTNSQQPTWILTGSKDMGKFHVQNLNPLQGLEGKNCMLWLRPEGSKEIYPLGTLPDSGNSLLKIGEEMRSMLPGKLMVTLEDASKPMPPRPDAPAHFEGRWINLTKL